MTDLTTDLTNTERVLAAIRALKTIGIDSRDVPQLREAVEAVGFTHPDWPTAPDDICDPVSVEIDMRSALDELEQFIKPAASGARQVRDIARSINLTEALEWGTRERLRTVEGLLDKLDDALYELAHHAKLNDLVRDWPVR